LSGEVEDHARPGFDFYGPQYARFGTPLAIEMRRAVYGEDIGQQGWRTAAEQSEIADLIRNGPQARVLDVACGSGGPGLALVQRTACRLIGLDVEPDGIAYASAQASARGLASRATFTVCDCSAPLPFEDAAFDAVLCIDAISHLNDRARTLSEWARVLARGGRMIFTDVFVLTGPVAKSEIEIRASVGFHLFVPPGINERFIEAAGLTLMRCEDRTAAVADIASRWHAVRSDHASALIGEEGRDWFERRQRFLAIAAELAASRRLSRFLYVAEKRMA
jgi:SAM-dependent methyltransferase